MSPSIVTPSGGTGRYRLAERTDLKLNLEIDFRTDLHLFLFFVSVSIVFVILFYFVSRNFVIGCNFEKSSGLTRGGASTVSRIYFDPNTYIALSLFVCVSCDCIFISMILFTVLDLCLAEI